MHVFAQILAELTESSGNSTSDQTLLSDPALKLLQRSKRHRPILIPRDAFVSARKLNYPRLFILLAPDVLWQYCMRPVDS